MSACGCCSQPPCPAPSLVCESFSATGSKCGFEHDGKIYLTKTSTDQYGFTTTSNYDPATCEITTYCSEGQILTSSYICEQSESDEETGSSYYAYYGVFSYAKISSDCTIEVYQLGVSRVISSSEGYSYDCQATADTRNPEGWVFSGTITENGETRPLETGQACSNYVTPCETWYYTPVEPTEEYSNEFTTAALLDKVLAAIPSDPNGSYCSAYRNLSPDESSFALRRTRWHIEHEPTGTCYLKVWLQKRFTPEGGGSDTITPITAYEWTGSGNPCFPEPTKSVSDPDNLILGTQTTENEPDTDGTTTIEIVKWSCVEGYEPGEGDPNGFPPLPEE